MDFQQEESVEGGAGKQREQQRLRRHEGSWTVAGAEASKGAGEPREDMWEGYGWGRAWSHGVQGEGRRTALWAILDGV